MLVRFEEKPTSRKGVVKFNDPATTLEIWASGAPNESVLEAALLPYISDTYTVNGVTRFFESFSYEPVGIGSGAWSVSVVYRKNPNTTELTVHPGGGTRKVFQSKQTVRVYNCFNPASASTLALGVFATAAAATATTAAAAAIVLRNTVLTDEGFAITAANGAATAAGVPGVDATVKALVDSAALTTNGATAFAHLCATHVLTAAGQTNNTVTDVGACVAAGDAGDAITAMAQSDQAGTDAGLADAASTSATTDQANAQAIAPDAQVKADQATAAAAGGNAQTIAAADAAQTAAVAAQTVADSATAAALGAVASSTAADAAAAAAALVADGAEVDALTGNGAPDFQHGINVTEHSVEGVDVPDRKFEFSVNKKLSRAAISGAYIMQLYGLLNTTNDAPYTIIYNGQTLTFATGALLFLEFPFKMTSDQVLDITYKFGAQRSILAADGFTVGKSAKILKQGWEYFWVYYKDQRDPGSNRTVRRPISAYVERVFDPGDYSLIRL